MFRLLQHAYKWKQNDHNVIFFTSAGNIRKYDEAQMLQYAFTHKKPAKPISKNY